MASQKECDELRQKCSELQATVAHLKGQQAHPPPPSGPVPNDEDGEECIYAPGSPTGRQGTDLMAAKRARQERMSPPAPPPPAPPPPDPLCTASSTNLKHSHDLLGMEGYGLLGSPVSRKIWTKWMTEDEDEEQASTRQEPRFATTTPPPPPMNDCQSALETLETPSRLLEQAKERASREEALAQADRMETSVDTNATRQPHSVSPALLSQVEITVNRVEAEAASLRRSFESESVSIRDELKNIKTEVLRLMRKDTGAGEGQPEPEREVMRDCVEGQASESASSNQSGTSQKSQASEKPSPTWWLAVCGPPGSGKGACIRALSEALGLVHVTSAGAVTHCIQEENLVGRLCLEAMKDPDFVRFGPEISMMAVIERLKAPDVARKGCLIDGLLRDQAQAQAMKVAQIPIDKVILCDVSEDALLAHRTSRFIDHQTATVYFQGSPNWPEDPQVAARLTQRPDDTEDAVRTNLAEWKELRKSLQKVFQTDHGDMILALDTLPDMTRDAAERLVRLQVLPALAGGQPHNTRQQLAA